MNVREDRISRNPRSILFKAFQGRHWSSIIGLPLARSGKKRKTAPVATAAVVPGTAAPAETEQVLVRISCIGTHDLGLGHVAKVCQVIVHKQLLHVMYIFLVDSRSFTPLKSKKLVYLD